MQLEVVQEGCLVEVDLGLDGSRSLVPTSQFSSPVWCDPVLGARQGHHMVPLGAGYSLVGDPRGCSHSYNVRSRQRQQRKDKKFRFILTDGSWRRISEKGALQLDPEERVSLIRMAGGVSPRALST